MSNQDNPPIVKVQGPWVAHALKPGQAIMEYVIERTLGGGGFGITYLARDGNLNLPVALKEFLPGDLAMRTGNGLVQPLGDACKDQFQWGLERFLSEARVLANFRHPNIVRVLRYFPANGTAYIVMEFESGDSLKKWLPRINRLDRTTLLKLILPLLDGLEMVHKAGFLHRDIKPDNIYIRSDNSPVLIDFGSARSTTAGNDMTSVVSPGFAPLEQYQANGNQGPWTDLYSLAAVMYWLISGIKPLDSIGRLKQDTMVSVTKLDRLNLLGRSVLGAIDWALNPDEKKRPQSVAQFRARLIQSVDLDDLTQVSGNEELIQLSAESSEFGVTTISGNIISGIEGTRSNLVCSILFLDIVAYSKTSVNEQYQLKSYFNQLIAGKLSHVPDNSRLTLDTGDGAAICFTGDPEEVLYSAIDIQRALALQDRLLVRMGLHIGPVRIMNDLNGRNNVIGDGINVAQRVMSFAESNTLVVSRAFYDIAVCLTDGGERNFNYLGERRDKHDRVHEIYSVVTGNEGGGLGDTTIRLNEKSNTLDNNISRDVLSNIEKELAQHLGPLASVLIKKMKRRASSEVELRKLLAQSISNNEQRELFIQGVNSRSRPQVSISTPLKSVSGPTGFGTDRSQLTRNNIPGSKDPNTVTYSWLPVDLGSKLEKHLSKAIGPVARILIKKEAAKTDNVNTLCDALSLHIDKLESRTQFIKEINLLRNDKR